jgi:hypothetical protein
MTQIGARVITTTIPTTSKDAMLWSGMVSFTVDPNCTLHYLAGAEGGYVSVVCVAESESQFVERVFLFLAERQLTLKTHPTVSRVMLSSKEELSTEWRELSVKALETKNVESTTFHLFNSAEGEEQLL